MKPINLQNVKESIEGSFDRLPRGAYPCIITSVTDFPSSEYLSVVVDIVAGEYERYFDTPFYADKPFAHSLVFSYKESALPMLKGRLHVISDCNTGYDAESAFYAGNEQSLVGKVMGVVFAEQEYLNKKTKEFEYGSPQPARLCRLTPDELEKPENKEPKQVPMTEKRKIAAIRNAKIAATDEDARRWLKQYEADKAAGGAPAPYSTSPSAPADTYNGDIPFMM